MLNKEEIMKWFEGCDLSYLSCDNVHELYLDIKDRLPEGTEMYSTFTSFAIAIPHEDYVIEIPFKGDGFNKVTYSPFTHAGEIVKDDYTFQELTIYGIAKCWEGVREFFAEIEYFGSLDDRFVYLKEKIDRTPNTIDEWEADVIKYHGTKAFKAFKAFCKEYNVPKYYQDYLGYIGERPVLFKYSEIDERDF